MHSEKLSKLAIKYKIRNKLALKKITPRLKFKEDESFVNVIICLYISLNINIDFN